MPERQTRVEECGGYQDRDGNPVSLFRLCRTEPGWAENRLRADDARISALDEVLRWLSEALPTCAACGAPAMHCNGPLFACDEHNELSELYELEHAEALRAALRELREPPTAQSKPTRPPSGATRS